jgi:hypothetical protein
MRRRTRRILDANTFADGRTEPAVNFSHVVQLANGGERRLPLFVAQQRAALCRRIRSPRRKTLVTFFHNCTSASHSGTLGGHKAMHMSVPRLFVPDPAKNIVPIEMFWFLPNLAH